jgi:CelD/BcsL family acetyltransferase involved in cellulose biosynthesis
MLVGWLDHGPVAFKVGPFVLFRSEARILRFVYGGFLGNRSRQNSRLLVHEISKSLHRREAQAAVFSQLAVNSDLCDLAKRKPAVFCRDHFTPVESHRFLALPASFEKFFGGLSRKSRQHFTRHSRMLVRDFPGRVRFQSVVCESEVEDFARKADHISQRTHRRALGTGFVNDLETREMLRLAARKASLRTSLLYVDDQPVAFAGGIINDKTLYATFTGYDPAFKKYSPGLQTQMRLIEESFKPRGSILRVDAGLGDYRYKRALFGSSWEEHPVWIFAPTAKGLKLNVLKLVSTVLHFCATRILARSEYLRGVKKRCYQRVMRDFPRKTFASRSK